MDIIGGDGGPFHIFKLSDPDVSVFDQSSYSINDRFYWTLPGGDYSVIETVDDGCDTYTLCKDPSKFVDEFFFSIATGLSINSAVYGEEEQIIITTQGPPAGNPFQVYDFASQAFIWGGTSYSSGDQVSVGLAVGNYAIIETSDYSCFSLSYDECKSSPAFLKEVLFRIVPAGTHTGGDASAGPINSYPPVVEIISPKFGDMISNMIHINYKAVDLNDNDSKSKNNFGLLESPVSLFYSDKLINSNPMFVSDGDLTLIKKDLPASGTYDWDVTKVLSEGKFYRILARAVDKAGLVGQAISEYFNVDLSPPTFIITTSPEVVKQEDVTIIIESSEDLVSLPQVFVRQYGGKPIKVEITGHGSTYKGVYKVIKGFDGTAQVEISGLDAALNTGTLVVGGGTFSVGINPPIEPVITSPVNNEKVTSETISITGTTRDDTYILLTVNGVDKYKAKPNSKGEYVVKDVRLKKNAKNGKNIINIVAIDGFNVSSKSVVSAVLFNAAPAVAVLKPEPNAILGGTTTFITKSSDDNNDLIHFLYEIAPAGKSTPEESDWKKVADVPSSSIYFDSTKFLDGDYFLRVSADDGASVTTAPLINIHIRNATSFFIRFYDGINTTVNKRSALVRGVVNAQRNAALSPTIKSLEYSLNAGQSWISAKASDGAMDEREEIFEVNFSNLKDGINDVLWRAKDSRGVIVKSSQPIIVDMSAPKQPTIVFPVDKSVIGKDNNELIGKGKFAFTLRGKAEPGTTVHIEIDGRQFAGRASFDGTFRITNINLPRIGKYTVKAFTVDEALNKSTVLEYSFLYDNVPKIVFINPSQGRGLNNSTQISWLATDLDGNAVANNVLSYRRIGQSFVVLARNLKENKFDWDIKKLPEANDYELRLETSDGLIASTTYTTFSIDHTAPTLSSLEIKNSNLAKGEDLEVKGQAVDTNSGVMFVEYSFLPIDSRVSDNFSQSPWYKANIIRNRAVFGKNISFSIKDSLPFTDGEYTMILRAVDVAGNVSTEKTLDVSIDDTPPRVGSFEVFSSGVKVWPVNSLWTVSDGNKLGFNISLEQDTKTASLYVNKEAVTLVKDLSTGIWRGELMLNQQGANDIHISAVDNGGNKIEQVRLVTIYLDGGDLSKKNTKSHWWSWLFDML